MQAMTAGTQAMTPGPTVEILDEEFLVGQRARLSEDRETLVGVAEMLASEVNGLLRQRDAGGPTEEGFGRGESPSVDLERARSEHARVMSRLAELHAALARLDAHSYGRCEVCGGPIGEARLEAVPTALRCIECQAGRSRARSR